MGVMVDGSLNTLIQGVSQQAPVDRLDGQHELEINMSNDPEKGLLRRPPTELVAEIAHGARVYEIIEHSGDMYIMCIYDSDIKMFSLDGTEHTITMTPSATAYLLGDSIPAVLSIDGQTFIANPEVEVQMLPAVKQYTENSALVFLLGGQYGRTFSVTLTVNGTAYTASYTTPDGSQTAHGAQVATNAIATQLVTALIAALPGSDYSVTRNSDVILIKYTGSAAITEFNITTQDGDGGANMYGFTNRVGDIGDLPRYAPHDYVVRVVGTEGTVTDDFYLRFDKENGSTTMAGEGLWVECVAPGVEYSFDLATMPHIITKDAGGFYIDEGDWIDRRVGDDTTNPVPTFVGRTISDIALFQGRLCFLSGANVILSRSDKYTDFWKNSATQLVNDDPIDISSAALNSAPKMRYAVPHNRDLVIFADSAQFVIFGRNAITPSNTSLVLTTTYEANLDASPVPSGKNVFYAINYGGFTGIKEFYTDGDVDINASRPITAHCTKFIPGTIKRMHTTTNFDMLLVQTTTDPKDLYLYEYIWINDEKAQSAWSKWTFQRDVVFFAFVDDLLYIVTADSIGTYLCKVRLDRAEDAGGYQVHLDNKMWAQNVDDVISIPPALQHLEDIMFIQDEDCPEPGLAVPIEVVDGNDMYLSYSMNGGSVICGSKYESTVRFTRPVLKDGEGEPVVTGVLSVHHYIVSVLNSGHFKSTIVTKYTDETIDMDYDALLLGSSVTAIGVPAVVSYDYTVPFLHDVALADLQLSTDKHTPLRITQLSWKGDYIKHGSHV